MMLYDEKLYKLGKTYNKVMYFSQTYERGLVIICQVQPMKDRLIHYSANNQILFEYNFDSISMSMEMLNNCEVVCLEVQIDKFTVINLKQKKVTQYKHYYIITEPCQCQIFSFIKNQFICIKENGAYNDNRFKLTYHHFPTLKNEPPDNYCKKNMRVFEATQDQWTYEYATRKANNESKIMWFKNRHDEAIDIRTFDLNKGYQFYIMANTMGLPYEMSRVECALENAWEISENVYCLVFFTSKIQAGKTNSAGIVNNNYIFDAVKSTLTEASFWFDEKYNDFLIDQMNAGQVSMFRTFYYDSGRPTVSPAYYVLNSEQRIVGVQRWICDHTSHWAIPSYEPNTFLNGVYQNSNVDQIKVQTKKYIQLKELSLFMMLNLNPNFDENLLSEVIALLGYKS